MRKHTLILFGVKQLTAYFFVFVLFLLSDPTILEVSVDCNVKKTIKNKNLIIS